MKAPIPLRSIRPLRRAREAIARRVLGTITRVATGHPVVALTFDDGPHPEYTPFLLDLLERYHAYATFFMLGEAAQMYPQIVERVGQAGHAIGNHSWDHPSFPSISGFERRAQIRRCAKAISPYGTRLFRPPYGFQNLAARLDAFMLGYQVVTWNVSTNDWRGAAAGSIADEVEKKIRPGSVIVLHDRLFDALEQSYFDRKATLDAVRILLHRLSGRFRFVTVPELLRHGKPQREIWLKRPDLELLKKLKRQERAGRRYNENPTNLMNPEKSVPVVSEKKAVQRL
jgi:peptidoglycan/xylan/chitin deacetylase (PgdA/CDA1 family)